MFVDAVVVALWRIYRFELSGRDPPVQHLCLHLEHGQTIYFLDKGGLQQSLETGQAEQTTLTEFFSTRLYVQSNTVKSHVILHGIKKRKS